MPELVLLCAHVGSRMMTRPRPARDAPDDANACALELLDLVRIVRKQPDRADAERFQRLCGKFVVSRIGRESEPAICFDRVETLVLQFVSLQLIDQADAASFLREIEDHAGGFFGDLAEGELELRAAVASLRCENVAGEALRVDAHERHLRAPKLAMLDRNSLSALGPAFDAQDRKLSEASGQPSRGHDLRLPGLFPRFHRIRHYSRLPELAQRSNTPGLASLYICGRFG